MEQNEQNNAANEGAGKEKEVFQVAPPRDRDFVTNKLNEKLGLNNGEENQEESKGTSNDNKEVAKTTNDEESKYFKTHFPDFDSVDKVKSSLTEYKTKAEKISEYEKEIEEQKATLEALKKETETYNKFPKLKTYKDMLESGKDIDENVIAFLNKDFSKVTDNRQLVFEALKEQNPKWSDKEVNFEIDTKYRTKEWGANKDEEGEDIPNTKNEVQDIMEMKMLRDAEEAKSNLTKKQEDYKLIKKESPEELEAKQKVAEERQKTAAEAKVKWEGRVKEAIDKKSVIESTTEKEVLAAFKTLTSGEEVQPIPFKYELAKEDKEKVSNVFQEISKKGLSALFDLFKNEKGEFDDSSEEKIADVIVNIVAGNKIKNKEAEHNFRQAMEHVAKRSRNIDFSRNTKESGKGNKSGTFQLAPQRN